MFRLYFLIVLHHMTFNMCSIYYRFNVAVKVTVRLIYQAKLVNLLAPELFFLILAHSVYKM